MRNNVLDNFKSWIKIYYSKIDMKNNLNQKKSNNSRIEDVNSNNNSFANTRIKNFVGHFGKD